MGGEVPAVQPTHAVPDQVDFSVGVDLGNALLEDLGAVDGTGGGGDAVDEDFDAAGFEDFFDAAPGGDLERGDGGPEGNGVEAEEAVAEDERVLGRAVCGM